MVAPRIIAAPLTDYYGELCVCVCDSGVDAAKNALRAPSPHSVSHPTNRSRPGVWTSFITTTKRRMLSARFLWCTNFEVLMIGTYTHTPNSKSPLITFTEHIRDDPWMRRGDLRAKWQSRGRLANTPQTDHKNKRRASSSPLDLTAAVDMMMHFHRLSPKHFEYVDVECLLVRIYMDVLVYVCWYVVYIIWYYGDEIYIVNLRAQTKHTRSIQQPKNRTRFDVRRPRNLEDACRNDFR